MTKAPLSLSRSPIKITAFRAGALALKHCLFAWLLLVLSIPANAQLTYTTNTGAITITGYSGFVGDLTIPDAINELPVKHIKSVSFMQHLHLKSVIIPDTVTNIGSYAFSGCTGLTSVKISNKLISIGDTAFSLCASLTEVTIPNSVTSMGTYAFASCTGLKSVAISTALTSILESAFGGCTGLTNVTIPNSVTNIRGSAFHGCTALTSVTIPKSVTSIGTYSFDQCSSLKAVYFQGSQPKTGVQAFGTGKTKIYYLPGTMGWGSTYVGHPTVVWNPIASTDDLGFGVKANQFGFNITGSSDIEVVVETCDNLLVPTWLAVGTNILASGSAYFSDPSWTNHPGRFYRFRSP